MHDIATFSKSQPISRPAIHAQTVWIAFFAVATALGARVEIPNTPVPYTLQTMFVLIAGAFLGPRNGAISQLLYLALGVLGLPVFSLGGFGLAKLIGPTGGYLLAFPVAATVVGFMVQRYTSRAGVLLSMGAGLLFIFTLGTLHLNTFYLHDLSAAITSGFLIFSWWDVIKLLAAATIYFEIAKRWRRIG
jgi:biotin transport system substrate-specific component